MITRLLGELGGDLVAEESCLVCLEPVNSSACVRCSAPPHHVLCDSCFLSHVDSVPEPRIRACRGRVPCPGDGWHDSHFGPSEIASVALRCDGPRPLEQMLEKLLPRPTDDPALPGGGAEAPRLAQQLLLRVTISCPWCAAVVDPDPDGCRAMRCGVCGFYYCWLCFHKELTNQAIHRHVRDAHGDLFVAQRAVDLAHGAWRRSVVSDFMRGIEDAALRDAVLSLTRSNLAALDASLPRHASLLHGAPSARPAGGGEAAAGEAGGGGGLARAAPPERRPHRKGELFLAGVALGAALGVALSAYSNCSRRPPRAPLAGRPRSIEEIVSASLPGRAAAAAAAGSSAPQSREIAALRQQNQTLRSLAVAASLLATTALMSMLMRRAR